MPARKTTPTRPATKKVAPAKKAPRTKTVAIETKPINPKEGLGSLKLPLSLWPATATAMGCIGMLDGATKYGRSNFIAGGTSATVMVDAAMRHLQAWQQGEDNARDSGVPHLANALATIAIIVDAQAAGVLVDDRAYANGYAELASKLTPLVEKLKSERAHLQPKHYTIADSK
jgi:hypothetical protein